MTSSRPTLDAGALDGTEEPTALGASPTLQGGRKAKRKERKERRTSHVDRAQQRDDSSSSNSPIKGALIVVVAILLFAIAPVVAAAFKRTPADRVGVSYSGGPFSGTSFQRVVEPGAGFFFNGFFGNLYLYPAGVANYQMPDPSDGAGVLEASSVVFPASDLIPVTVELTANYRLNHDTLQGFHESLGMEYEAHTPEGWDEMERIVIRGALSGALQEALRSFDSDTLLNDPDAISRLEADMEEATADRLISTTGGNYFCSAESEPGGPCEGPSVVITSLDVPGWAGAAGSEQETAPGGD